MTTTVPTAIPKPVSPGPAAPAARPDAAAWRAALAAGGCALVLTGGLACLAWAGGNLEYIQVDSTLPPMHYNAAFGLILLGYGYLAVARGWDRTARRAAGGLAAWVLVTLVGAIPGLGLGLDRWAFVPPASDLPFPPGGVAPRMSIALGLAGMAVLLAGRREVTRTHVVLGTSIGVVLVAGCSVALFAGQTGSFLARSSEISAFGMIGVGVAGLVLLSSPYRKGIPAFAIGRTLPLTVGLIGMTVTLALWLGLNAEQNRRIRRQVQFEVVHVRRSAQDRLPEQVRSVASLAERWTRDDPEKIRADIGSYVGERPGCLGVARVEPDLGVTWVEARRTPVATTTLDDLGVAGPVAAAVRTGRPVVVRVPRSFWQGARVLVIYAPHVPFAAESGGLISVFRSQDLFDTIINTNVATGYAVTVTDNGDPLFGRYEAESEYRHRWEEVLPLQFEGFNWSLSVWPTRDVLERESLFLPKLAVVIGLLTTALLALAVYLAQTARRRTAELEREVREREETRRALKLSEEKYRTLIENLGQGIFLQDRDHRFVAANAEFCRSVGRAEADVVGRTEAALFDPRRAASHAEEAGAVLAEGKRVESEETLVLDGRRVCVRRALTPVRDAAGRTTGVLGICWDVTEQRQLEAHVHQASKMDAIGQLAGGIAHDFNNLLTAILGNLELILVDKRVDAPTRDLATAAQTAASRAASLTQQLLGFSRKHQLDWVPTDVNTVVDEVVTLLRRTIDPLVRIETRCAAGLWPVQADPAQLNQVLMNLCLNARDAIVGGGRITIETACVGPADLPPDGPAARTGEFVRLRLTDTGGGMTDEVKARIFEPFFTTKEVGKGTGLGLPMVFAIVRQHRGWIDFWSEVGRGTRFDIYLPRGEGAKPGDGGRAAPVPRRTGKETILVVDDEEAIRRLAATVLRGRGYTVLEAADGQQAVDLYSREGDRIDLVLLDLTMPVLSGREAFRHLVRLNPRVRVLFASGYAVDQMSELEKDVMAGFVSKPYRPTELIVAVEDALECGRSGPSAPSGRTEVSQGRYCCSAEGPGGGSSALAPTA